MASVDFDSLNIHCALIVVRVQLEMAKRKPWLWIMFIIFLMEVVLLYYQTNYTYSVHHNIGCVVLDRVSVVYLMFINYFCETWMLLSVELQNPEDSSLLRRLIHTMCVCVCRHIDGPLQSAVSSMHWDRKVVIDNVVVVLQNGMYLLKDERSSCTEEYSTYSDVKIKPYM
jgi:hypothetical protein